MGLLIESDQFCAFVATAFGGRDYVEPVLFTISSQDGAPLADAASVRIYHGFGDDQIVWRGSSHSVKREAVV